ncbi:recombinase family protein [Actinomadura litoris]|uniref:recombinase family protein n=1 Tax=Actinomadura litoris TaxID=2678616 RepID=UPI001FA6C1A4|nr:recombinase family protein [Actinomadura litoris]
MRTVIYLRTAEGPRGDLERAEKACRAFAVNHGWEVAAVYRDAAHGMDNHRPEYVRLKNAIKDGEVAHLISASPTMLTRDHAEGRRLAQLADEHGVKLHGVWSDTSLMGSTLAEADAAMGGRVAVDHVDEPGDVRVEMLVMLLFGDAAELTFGNRTSNNPLRVPAVDIVLDTGLAMDALAGARLTAVVTEDPEEGQRVTAYRRL